MDKSVIIADGEHNLLDELTTNLDYPKIAY